MYQDRIESAISVLETHNQAIGKNEKGEPNQGYVNPVDFVNCIKLSGGTNDDRLKGMSYEDILTCLPELVLPNGKIVKPVALAKDLAKVFRGKDELLLESSDKRPISSRKVENMTLRELVEAFDPEESTSNVAKRLKEISKGQPFIVFSSGRVVDVETTLKLITELKAGYPSIKTVTVNNEVKQVFQIGDLPDAMAEENPLYEGRPLRPDESCDQTGRSWAGISLQVRQLIYLAVELGELKVNIPNGIKLANDVIDMALAPDAFAKMSQLYRKAALEFAKFSKNGGLPLLKVPLNAVVSNKVVGPFDEGRQVVWAKPPQNKNYYQAFANPARPRK